VNELVRFLHEHQALQSVIRIMIMIYWNELRRSQVGSPPRAEVIEAFGRAKFRTMIHSMSQKVTSMCGIPKILAYMFV
jgi:hypothetical protein